ncbi:MAG: hypothetical protein LUQ40_01725 [Methanomicrobiales archaeon]|nr:hypothetical protein [Methanomicrobiales archaeon]
MNPSPTFDFESIYITVLQLVDIATSAHECGDTVLLNRSLADLKSIRDNYSRRRHTC